MSDDEKVTVYYLGYQALDMTIGELAYNVLNYEDTNLGTIENINRKLENICGMLSGMIELLPREDALQVIDSVNTIYRFKSQVRDF
jgi:hypothetical protein